MERYDPGRDRWSVLAPMNNFRDGACMVADDSNIYAVTGFDGNAYLNSMEVYDPNKDRWRSEGRYYRDCGTVSGNAPGRILRKFQYCTIVKSRISEMFSVLHFGEVFLSLF